MSKKGGGSIHRKSQIQRSMASKLNMNNMIKKEFIDNRHGLMIKKQSVAYTPALNN